MSTTSECQLFSTPNPETLYSHRYFLSLTFDDTLYLEHSYPSLLPIGSVIDWVFEHSVCHSSQGSTIQPFELIPHYDDVREIIAGMPFAYAESMRSVRLTLLVPGSIVPHTVSYHFSKAWLQPRSSLPPLFSSSYEGSRYEIQYRTGPYQVWIQVN